MQILVNWVSINFTSFIIILKYVCYISTLPFLFVPFGILLMLINTEYFVRRFLLQQGWVVWVVHKQKLLSLLVVLV